MKIQYKKIIKSKGRLKRVKMGSASIPPLATGLVKYICLCNNLSDFLSSCVPRSIIFPEKTWIGNIYHWAMGNALAIFNLHFILGILFTRAFVFCYYLLLFFVDIIIYYNVGETALCSFAGPDFNPQSPDLQLVHLWVVSTRKNSANKPHLVFAFGREREIPAN